MRGKLLPKVPLGQDSCVQGVHGLGVVAQASHRRDVPKLPLLEEALGLMQGVLLLSQEQLLPHVVLELVLRALLRHLHLPENPIRDTATAPRPLCAGPELPRDNWSPSARTGPATRHTGRAPHASLVPPGLEPQGSVLMQLVPTLPGVQGLQLPDPRSHPPAQRGDF